MGTEGFVPPEGPTSPQADIYALGKVLYEDLQLTVPVKYGKGKTQSTAADILEGLEHPIARLILEYRQLSKLKGTYVDALPALIDSATGRLHTTFNQIGAATGRVDQAPPDQSRCSGRLPRCPAWAA